MFLGIWIGNILINYIDKKIPNCGKCFSNNNLFNFNVNQLKLHWIF